MLKRAEDIGVEASQISPTYHHKPSDEEVFQHTGCHAAIADDIQVETFARTRPIPDKGDWRALKMTRKRYSVPCRIRKPIPSLLSRAVRVRGKTRM